LLNGVEDTYWASRIIAYASQVLLVALIGREVVVNEQAFVLLCTDTLVDMEILGEEGYNVLMSIVVGVPCVDELAEGSVNEFHARGAISEALDDGSDV
jgi:hypothetical protein